MRLALVRVSVVTSVRQKMCEKCNKNFAHVGKLSGQISTQSLVVKMLEKLPFIWIGEKQLIQVDKREVIQMVKELKGN
jgi:hypothetical protein